MSKSGISRTAQVPRTAKIGPRTRVGDSAQLGQWVVLGSDTSVGEHTGIGARSRIGDFVLIGPNVHIESAAIILRGARICPNDVHSVSSDGRSLNSQVTVGPNVLLHDEVELGSGAIIPTQMATLAQEDGS